MGLSPQQFDMAREKLEPHLQRGCPVCQGKSFAIESIAIAPMLEGGGIALGGGVPVLLVVCGTCAHVLSFAAKPLGLLEVPDGKS